MNNVFVIHHAQVNPDIRLDQFSLEVELEESVDTYDLSYSGGRVVVNFVIYPVLLLITFINDYCKSCVGMRSKEIHIRLSITN